MTARQRVGNAVRLWRHAHSASSVLPACPASLSSRRTNPTMRSRHAQPADRPRPLPAAGGHRPCPTASTSPCSAGTAPPSPWSSTRSTATTPLAEIALAPAPQPHRRPLARPRRRPAARASATAGASTGPRGPGHRFDPVARPARPGRDRAVRRRPSGAGRGEPTRSAPPAAASSSAGSLRLAGGRPAADAAGRHHHLRAARPRLHLPPVLAASRTPAPSPAWSRRSPT